MYNILYFMGISTQGGFERYRAEEIRGTTFESYQQKRQTNLYSELTSYRVDYLFYGPRERASFTINPEKIYPFLQQVYADQIVTIYQIL